MGGEMETGASAPKGGTSLAQQYIETVTRRVKLPSGAFVVIRRGSLLDFLFSGSIPAPLLSLLMKGRRGVAQDQQEMSQEEQRQFAIGIGMLCSFVVHEPTVVPMILKEDGTVEKPPVDPAKNEIGAWQLTDDDKMFLYTLAMTDAGVGEETESKFPPVSGEQTRSAGPAPDGEGVQPAAERPSGPEVGTPDRTGAEVPV